MNSKFSKTVSVSLASAMVITSTGLLQSEHHRMRWQMKRKPVQIKSKKQ